MTKTNQLSCIEQLNIANARLHELSRQTNTWMWETNADHLFTYFSNNLERLTNLKICDLVGTSRLDAALTNHEKSWHEHAKHHINHTPFTDFQYQRLTQQGDVRHIIVSGWPLFDDEGNFEGFRGTGRDETNELLKSNRQVEKEEHLLLEIEYQRSELSVVLENLTQSVIWFDREGVIRLKNAQTAEIVGFKPHELDRVHTIQDYLRLMAQRGDFGDVDIDEEVRKRSARLCEELKEERSYRVHIERNNRFLDVNLKQLPDGSRILTQIDVTKEAHIKAIAKNRDQILREIMSNMDYAVVLMDEDLNVDFANERFCELLNFKQEFINTNPNMEELFDKLRVAGPFAYPDWDDKQWRSYVAKQRENIFKSDGRKVERLMADGRTVVEKVIKLGSGKRLLTFIDITEQKQREETLSQIINAIDYGTLILDADMNVEMANEPFSNLMRVPPQMLAQKPSMSVILDKMLEQKTTGYHGGSDKEWKEYRDDVCEWVTNASEEPAERLRADGKTILSGCVPLPGNKRLLTYFDVSDVKLREKMLNTLISKLDQGVMLLGKDFSVKMANAQFTSLWGMTSEFFEEPTNFRDVLDFNRYSGFYPVDGTDQKSWDMYANDRITAIKSGDIESVELQRKDGKTLLFSAVKLPGDDYMLTYFDITDQKNRQALLKTMIDNVEFGMVVLDENLKTEQANDYFCDLMEIDAEYMIEGPHFSDVLDRLNDNHCTSHMSDDQKEWEKYRKSVMAMIAKGAISSQEAVLRNGKTIVRSCVPLPGGKRMVTYFDITDLKRMENDIKQANELLEERVERRTQELRKTQASLVKKERQALLGDLVASLCHELRNPLNALNTSLFIIRRKVEGDFPKLTKAFDRSERTIERCTHILDDLYDYALVDKIKVTCVDMASWLAREAEKAQVPMAFNISFDVDEGLTQCEIDEAQLGSAVRKLITNAAQAIAAKPDPTVPPQISISAKVSGENVRIIIEDNGPGMNDETYKKALEPLFSTRGFGVGLGLPIAQQIVKRHGGSFDLLTQEGEGTSVLISLPIKHDTSLDDKPSTAYKPTLNGKHRAA